MSAPVLDAFLGLLFVRVGMLGRYSSPADSLCLGMGAGLLIAAVVELSA